MKWPAVSCRYAATWTCPQVIHTFGAASSVPSLYGARNCISSSPLEKRNYNSREKLRQSKRKIICHQGWTSPVFFFASACWQAEQGIMALIGVRSSTDTRASSAISTGLRIPQITPTATNPQLGTSLAQTDQLLALKKLKRYSQQCNCLCS